MCLLDSPFLEPLLRTLLRTLSPFKTHCKTPSKNPSENLLESILENLLRTLLRSVLLHDPLGVRPFLVEARPNCARQSLASTVSALAVAGTSCCHPSSHANAVTSCLLTPCLNPAKNYITPPPPFLGQKGLSGEGRGVGAQNGYHLSFWLFFPKFYCTFWPNLLVKASCSPDFPTIFLIFKIFLRKEDPLQPGRNVI